MERKEDRPTEGAPRPDPNKGPSSQEKKECERRIWRRSFLAAVGLHLLLFLLWTSTPVPQSPFGAEGERRADPSPADGAVEAVSMRPAAPDPLVPPEVPVPVPEDVEPPEVDEDAELELGELEELMPGSADVPGEADRGEGDPGRDAGDGEGDAGAGAEGQRRMVPPSPRGMIVPPSNENMRGTEIEVWVFVNAQGQVIPDSTRLAPPTRDDGFNDRLRREAAQWVFEPARRDGQPVAAWFPYRISM